MRPPALLVAAVVALVTTAGCAAPDPATPPGGRVGPPEPTEARALALTQYGLVAGGDYAGAWELWSDSAKRSLDRTEFVRLHEACATRPGVPPTVVTARPVDASTVDIDWRLGTRTGTDRLVHVNGAWRFEPGPAALDLYRHRGTGDCAVT